ncbi:MAG: hypothetical protein OEZ10_00025 [Gammaproteobacteria bacterium]|nr:hypothetical protein [Gammaproteobacteria bacterium]
MNDSIAKRWLAEAERTANSKDLEGHLNLISRHVSLQGVPGFDNIDYDAWAAQCQHEFENNILKSVRYDGFKLVADSGNRVMFKTFETVEAHDGTVNAQGVEMLLELEPDGSWRLVQERVLPDDETEHDGLLPTRD